jgi:hypothetical protein
VLAQKRAGIREVILQRNETNVKEDWLNIAGRHDPTSAR